MGGKVSKPTDPTRELQVIGAGYSRTGTLSMAMALEKLLDGPVMHGGSQFVGREDAYCKLWVEIFQVRNDRPRLLKLLKEATQGFVAVTDAPGNIFIEELLELYPDVVVVTVRRNRESWWKSLAFVTEYATARYLDYLLLPIPGKRWFPTLMKLYLQQQEEQFGPTTENRLDEHNEFVKRITPPEKLHVMELSEGWSPLCKALGKPIPGDPFPRANDANSVERVSRQAITEACIWWTGIFAVTGAIGYGAVFILKRHIMVSKF